MKVPLYFYIYEILAAIVALDLGKVLVCPLGPGGEVAEEEKDEEKDKDARDLYRTDIEEVQPALVLAGHATGLPPTCTRSCSTSWRGSAKVGVFVSSVGTISSRLSPK